VHGVTVSVADVEALPSVAVMVTEVEVETEADAKTVKVCDVLPAAMITEAGAVATGVLLLVSVTIVVAAAGAESVTVPVTE
jgi:hypothetical protein